MRTAATRTRRQADQDTLPPVAVDCNRCGGQFLTRFPDQKVVHCHRCHHSIRVKRPDARVIALRPRPAPPAVSEPGDDIVDAELVDDDDDDGQVYCYNAAGQLVPAMWDGSAWTPAATPPAALTGYGTPPAIEAARPQPARQVTLRERAVALLGWEFAPYSDEACQIIRSRQQCSGAPRFMLQGRGPRDNAWICQSCLDDFARADS